MGRAGPAGYADAGSEGTAGGSACPGVRRRARRGRNDVDIGARTRIGGDDAPPEQGERAALWPARLAVVATLALYVTLPQQLTFGPVWVLPLLALALLVPLTVAVPRNLGNEPPWHRPGAISMIALINAFNVASLVLLVHYLLLGGKAEGAPLLVESIKIWWTTVLLFALWYGELDRGAPPPRCRPQPREPDFLFPQMQMQQRGGTAPKWGPGFVDYLYLSFTNATAFSPTDTLPLTPWAKLLMLVQSLASLLTVALVAARAVNILS